jgi:hypothetical protein
MAINKKKKKEAEPVTNCDQSKEVITKCDKLGEVDANSCLGKRPVRPSGDHLKGISQNAIS